MFQKILIPLDGSQLAERALEPALTIAKQTEHSQVILFRVPMNQNVTIMQDAYAGIMIPPEVANRAQIEVIDYLADVKQRIQHPNLQLTTKSQIGHEANAILEVAEEENVDLIVMSTHGRTGISRWVLGSVTEQVLAEATCPVMVIREDKPIHNMLITLDGSLLSETALPPGLTVAEKLGANLTLLTVEQPTLISAPDAARLRELDKIETGLSDTYLEDLNHRSEVYFESLPNRFSRLQNLEHVPYQTEISVGNPAERILDYVAEHDVDLVVMATHGRTGLQRWLYGSVTTKVLRKLPCAMLIVRSE